MCFSITAASAEERGTIIFHREEKEKTQVDQEKRAKRTGQQSQGASLCR